MGIEDEIKIVNRACAEIGASPIQGFDDDTPSARKAKSIYPSERDFLFGLYPWSFLTQRVQLVRQADPVNLYGWRYAFTSPIAIMGQPLALSPDRDFDDTKFRDYALEATRVLSDTDPLYAKVKVLVDAAAWEATCVAALVRALAGHFAFALRADKDTRTRLLAEAYGPPEAKFMGGMVGAAIAVDARANPPKALARGGSDPLTRAMRGRAAWR